MNTRSNSYWHQVPFVRMFFPFVLGIGVSMFAEFSYFLSFIFLIISGLLNVMTIKWLKSINHFWITGFTLNVFVFCFGLALHVSQKDILNSSHFSKYTSKYIKVRILEPLLERKKSYKGLAEVIEVVDSNGYTQKCIGKLAIYFQKDSSVISGIHYGDILLLKSNYKEAEPTQNPYEFNYKRYLAFNNIYHQSYLHLGDFIKTGISKKNFLFEFSYKAQQYFKDVLNKYVESKTEVAVSQALLYGYDDDIDADVVKAYSNTGTLHVLAVSGMHVGIIFWIISKMLIFLDKRRWGIVLKAIISILLLWTYSLLCGFSPSILRATVMFSFMIVGKLFKRDVNIYNTLATSAFVILIFDTNIIANVGFQLSYLAVLGIVTFQKRIYNWYQPKYWLVDQIWNITAVSIAAQIATFPVGLLYFHQFPFCFLFSNLIIIPLTTVVLFFDIGLIAISQWEWAASLLGYCTKWLIYFTDHIVVFVENIPYAYTNGIHISIIETILIYILILYLFFWLIHIRHRYFKFALILAFVLVLFNGIESYITHQQKSITFYNTPKSITFNIIQNDESYFFADSTFINDDERFRFHIQQHIWANGITKVNKVLLKKSLSIQLAEQNIIFCNNKVDLNTLTLGQIIVLGKGSFIGDFVMNNPSKALFVLSSDLSIPKRQYFRNKLKELNILFVDINEIGSYSINL